MTSSCELESIVYGQVMKQWYTLYVSLYSYSYDVIKWRHFPHYWPIGEFTGHQWIPLTKASDTSTDVLFDLRLNKRLSKQSRRRWFETPLRFLWL